TDGGNEPSAARQKHCSPKLARGTSKPYTAEQEQPAGFDAATKTSAIVSDERDKPAINYQQVACPEPHEAQILRHENSSHTDEQNGRSAEDEPDSSRKQKRATQVERRSPRGSQRRVNARGLLGFMEHRPPGQHHTTHVKRQQDQRRHTMQRVQVTVAQVSQETSEAGQPAQQECPPSPGLARL